MYGMESGGNKKKPENKQKKELVFELEKDIVSDPENYKALRNKAKDRVQSLKTALRSGTSKENFDKYGRLLHGYVALKKVIEKIYKSGK